MPLMVFLPLVAAVVLALFMYSTVYSRTRMRDSQGKIIGFLTVTFVVALLLIFSSYNGLLSWPAQSPSIVEDSALSGNWETEVASEDSSQDNKFYGIMFDAGSTGSRIHVFEFIDQGEGKPPKYLREVFEQIKPGLSSYAEDPKKGAESLVELLDIGLKVVPENLRSKTWVALKATAGLRALPSSQSEALLNEVVKTFGTYEFRKAPDSVKIMEGDDEGKFSWFSVNFLANVLGNSDKMVGVMDLGGGSTQVTFVPSSDATIKNAPDGYVANTDIFGKSHKLYTHSYPLGLMAGRYKILGGKGEDSESAFKSVCIGTDLTDTLKFNNKEFSVSGSAPSKSRYDECRELAKAAVSSEKIHRVEEVNSRPFWIISYYYDRAVDSSLIDAEKGGIIKIQDYVESAKKECEKPSSETPWLCMDLCFVSSLLQDGFGFNEATAVTLRKQIDGNEISWALGAMFDWFGRHNDAVDAA